MSTLDSTISRVEINLSGSRGTVRICISITIDGPGDPRRLGSSGTVEGPCDGGNRTITTAAGRRNSIVALLEGGVGRLSVRIRSWLGQNLVVTIDSGSQNLGASDVDAGGGVVPGESSAAADSLIDDNADQRVTLDRIVVLKNGPDVQGLRYSRLSSDDARISCSVDCHCVDT